MFNISFQALRPFAGGFLVGKKFNFVSHANDELRPGRIARELDPEKARRKECLVKIRQKIKTLMFNEKIPGFVIAISLNGKVIYHAAFGYKDLENGALATKEDRGPVASVSKTFCAHLLLKMIMEQNQMHFLQEDFRKHVDPKICPIKFGKVKSQLGPREPTDRLSTSQSESDFKSDGERETPKETENRLRGEEPNDNQYLVWQRWPYDDDLLCKYNGTIPIKWLLCHMTGLQALERSEIAGCENMTKALERHFLKPNQAQESSQPSSSCEPGPSGLQSSSSEPRRKGPRRGAGDRPYDGLTCPPEKDERQIAFEKSLSFEESSGRYSFWIAATIIDRDWAFKRNIYNDQFLIENCPMATWFAGWPGLHYCYSNLGYNILAHIIENINRTGNSAGKNKPTYSEIGDTELRRLQLNETQFNMKGDICYNFSYMTGYKRLEEENAAGMLHDKAPAFDLSCRLGSEGLGSSCLDLLKWAHFNMKCYQNTDSNNGMLFSHDFMSEHQWSLRRKFEGGDGEIVKVEDKNTYRGEEKYKKEIRGYGMGWKVAMTNPYKFCVYGDGLEVRDYDETKKRPWVFRFWHNGCAPGHKAICYTRFKAGGKPHMNSLVDKTKEIGEKPELVVGTKDMHGKWSFHSIDEKVPDPLLTVEELKAEILPKRDDDFQLKTLYDLPKRFKAMYEANKKYPITLDPDKTPPKKKEAPPQRKIPAHRRAYLNRNKQKRTNLEIWERSNSIPCNAEMFNVEKERQCNGSDVDGVAIAIITNINNVELERFCDQVSDFVSDVFEGDTDADEEDDDDDDF